MDPALTRPPRLCISATHSEHRNLVRTGWRAREDLESGAADTEARTKDRRAILMVRSRDGLLMVCSDNANEDNVPLLDLQMLLSEKL